MITVCFSSTMLIDGNLIQVHHNPNTNHYYILSIHNISLVQIRATGDTGGGGMFFLRACLKGSLAQSIGSE